MHERYGNFADGLSREEINERLGPLNTRIAQLERDKEELSMELAAGNISQEDYERVNEPLDQQLSIAKYNRDAYLAQL
jgi:hypothetical protein